jgi:hypothetical protein
MGGRWTASRRRPTTIRADVHDMKIALGPLTRTLADLEESVRYLDKRVSRLEKAGHKDD